MKTIQWKIVLTDDNRIATMEELNGLVTDSVENQLVIIGILENLKQKHLDVLKTQYTKTIRKGDGKDDK